MEAIKLANLALRFLLERGSTPDRERGILDLIAGGLKNPEIASLLYLSPKTVRNHVSNILCELQAADRSEATFRAREAGLG